MAFEDLIVKEWLYKSILPPFVGFIVIYICIKHYYNRVYAYGMSRVALKLAKSKTVVELKSSLFSSMQSGKTIVEIGAGTGTNFTFYPEGCTLTCIEPKLEFESYVKDSIQSKGAHLRAVKFVQGYGETLSQAISPNSVDYVVCTMVLCSVRDIQMVANEIKKILKPGGIFFFCEHVLAPDDNRLARFYLNLMTPLTKFALDNCHFNREPWNEIKLAEFRAVHYQRKQIPNSSVLSHMRWLCIGTATK